MLNKPSFVEHNNYRFMIFSAPDDNSLDYWIEVIINTYFHYFIFIYFSLQQFKLYKVTDIVRTCERTYTEDEILKNGIRIHDLKFDDGKFPNKETIKSFLNIVDDVFPLNEKSDNNEEKCIAVHCIAGLGRYLKIL